MGYETIDEATRMEACERVKQIVKAIKAIKIKYYLNFSKISAKDKEKYDKLEANLEKISDSYNLNSLKVALMQEIEDKYDGKNTEDINKTEKKPEDNKILQACYGAIDAEKEALSRGRITQAARCKEMFKQYIKELDSVQYSEVINYKREKFAELMLSRENVEQQNDAWYNDMKKLCKTIHVAERKKALENIEKIKNEKIKNEKIHSKEKIKEVPVI